VTLWSCRIRDQREDLLISVLSTVRSFHSTLRERQEIALHCLLEIELVMCSEPVPKDNSYDMITLWREFKNLKYLILLSPILLQIILQFLCSLSKYFLDILNIVTTGIHKTSCKFSSIRLQLIVIRSARR
jgi:hypothetical protein